MRRMRHLKPREIQGCQLALDASIPTSMWDATSGGNQVAPDGTVARWEDQSGAANHLTQPNSANRPQLKSSTFNSFPTLYFDGSRVLTKQVQILDLVAANATDAQVLLVLSDTSTSAASFALSVIQSDSNRINVHASWSDAKIYCDIGHGTTARISGPEPTGWLNNPHVLTVGRQGPNMQAVIDNKLQFGRSNASGLLQSATVPIYVGKNQSFPGGHVGNISEVSLWAIAMPESVRKRVHNSRQRKWRISG